MTEKVELVINLEPWEDGKQYDRLGMDGQTTSILDIAVPSLTIPVKPGRNLAVIIEVAAMNDRQKKMGFNAAKELQERMLKQYGNKAVAKLRWADKRCSDSAGRRRTRTGKSSCSETFFSLGG